MMQTHVITTNRKIMKQKTDMTYMETANICMEALMEQFFSGPVGDNVLFMAYSDGKTVDCSVAGKGANIINTLCNCCNDNEDVLILLAKTVTTMTENKDMAYEVRKLIDDSLQNLIDKLNEIRNRDGSEED